MAVLGIPRISAEQYLCDARGNVKEMFDKVIPYSLSTFMKVKTKAAISETNIANRLDDIDNILVCPLDERYGEYLASNNLIDGENERRRYLQHTKKDIKNLWLDFRDKYDYFLKYIFFIPLNNRKHSISKEGRDKISEVISRALDDKSLQVSVCNHLTDAESLDENAHLYIYNEQFNLMRFGKILLEYDPFKYYDAPIRNNSYAAIPVMIRKERKYLYDLSILNYNYDDCMFELNDSTILELQYILQSELSSDGIIKADWK